MKSLFSIPALFAAAPALAHDGAHVHPHSLAPALVIALAAVAAAFVIRRAR